MGYRIFENNNNNDIIDNSNIPIQMIDITCSRIPVISIPINLGRDVNDIKKPPKFEATINTTNPNRWPPGAAERPTITYRTSHAIMPKKILYNIVMCSRISSGLISSKK